MRIGEALLETVRTLAQIYDDAALGAAFRSALSRRELLLVETIRRDDMVTPATLSIAFGSGASSPSVQRAVDRLLRKLDVVLIGHPTSGSPAPRIANAHELWRRLATADILMRTGSRRTARKHFLVALRSSLLPEQTVLELYALYSLMQEASFGADARAVRKYSSAYTDVLTELSTLHELARFTCIARTAVLRRRERVRYSEPIIDQSYKLLQDLSDRNPTDRIAIEAARLAMIVSQYRVDPNLGKFWLAAQRRAFKHSGVWNSSMKRENYTHELTLAGMVGDHKRALNYGKLLLEETKNGSTPWFTLIDFTTRALLLGGDSASAIPMLTAAFSHRQYRRLQPFLRNRLELSLGYAATLEEEAELVRTYSRRRTSRLQRGQQSFHDHMIDILRTIGENDSEPAIAHVKALSAQLKRLPVSERPTGALQMISNLNRALVPLARRGRSLTVEWIPGTPNTIVPWDLLWSWIRRRL
ncbi:MAG: hypothetical protein IPI24_06330 [Ignavibacteria bacterium]|nr:hypothetical protein [Ignavibacteria bacterium]MBK7577034.1 hypothetical protein [Ignavibacteria bacterium]